MLDQDGGRAGGRGVGYRVIGIGREQRRLQRNIQDSTVADGSAAVKMTRENGNDTAVCSRARAVVFVDKMENILKIPEQT